MSLGAEPSLRESEGWLSIQTAPKDGSIIELTAIDDDGEIFEVWPMRWAHIQRNGFFPGAIGMWTHPSGEMTWNEHPTLGGGPTHWRPLSARKDGSALKNNALSPEGKQTPESSSHDR